MPVREETIFAVSTGLGRAGIAVVRLSGPQAGTALRAIAGPLPAPRMATLRKLREHPEGEVIDQALVLWLPGPASYTGEDMAELHIHGGRAVIEAAQAALHRQPGLRHAEPGEFTRRAFLNGKIDLTAAEGVADLIDAETEAQRRQAVRQAGGHLQALYEGWRADLIEGMALIETGLDFADEGDVPADLGQLLRDRLLRLSAALRAHLADGRRGEILREGFHVVLAGPPNAGKSSLLNALARRDAAIVSAEAGTTRDVIEVRLDLDGLPIVLSDTAGIRAPRGAVEAEGIRRTLSRAQAGDLVLWLTEAGAPPETPPMEVSTEGTDVRWVVNKSDLSPPLVPVDEPRCIGKCRHGGSVATEVIASQALATGQTRAPTMRISVKTGDGIGPLISLITAAAREKLADTGLPALTRSRHRQELETALAGITGALNGDPRDLELRAEDLRLAATALGRLTGRIDVEDILDRIFSSFCIGK